MRKTETGMKPAASVIRPQSWLSFIAMAQRPSNTLQYSREEGEHALLFRGTRTFDEAIELARQGYAKGAQEAAELAAPLFTEIERRIVRAEPVYGYEGLHLDIPRFLDGDPECWMDFTFAARIESDVDPSDPFRQRLLRMVVNVSPSAEVTPDAIFKRGVVILALASLFEHAGHRVEIQAVLASEYKDRRVELWVPVKLMTEPLNPERLAFAVSHRAMSRRLGFAVLESATLPDDRCERGYGFAADVLTESDDMYFPKLEGSVEDQTEATLGWLLTALRSQGVYIREEVA